MPVAVKDEEDLHSICTKLQTEYLLFGFGLQCINFHFIMTLVDKKNLRNEIACFPSHQKVKETYSMHRE